MMEVRPYGHLNIDINQTISSLKKINDHSIKSINTPSVITFGQNDKLKEVSVGSDELLRIEDEMINQYSPHALKEGINYITSITKMIVLIVIIIIFQKLYKRYLKIQKKRRNFQEQSLKQELEKVSEEVSEKEIPKRGTSPFEPRLYPIPT